MLQLFFDFKNIIATIPGHAGINYNDVTQVCDTVHEGITEHFLGDPKNFKFV